MTAKKQPEKPARKAAKKTQATAPTHETFAQPAPELPTVAALANIAAAMSTPTEEPEIAASRAIRLWQACQRQFYDLARTCWIDEDLKPFGDAIEREEEAFLSACGLGHFTRKLARNRESKKELPLVRFLEACKPSPGSKTNDMLAWWKAFRERMGTGYSSGSKLFAAYQDFEIPSDPEGGISYNSLLPCWRAFTKFIERKKKEVGSDKGYKGQRTKTRRKVVTTLLANKKLTPDQLETFKDVTPEERHAEIDFFKMEEWQVKKFDAALASSKLSRLARPKTVKKLVD